MLDDEIAIVCMQEDDITIVCMQEDEITIVCMQEDEITSCPGCSYPLCSKECGEGKLHRQECHILGREEGGELVGGRIIGVLRLLGVKGQGGAVWDQIGSQVDTLG